MLATSRYHKKKLLTSLSSIFILSVIVIGLLSIMPVALANDALVVYSVGTDCSWPNANSGSCQLTQGSYSSTSEDVIVVAVITTCTAGGSNTQCALHGADTVASVTSSQTTTFTRIKQYIPSSTLNVDVELWYAFVTQPTVVTETVTPTFNTISGQGDTLEIVIISFELRRVNGVPYPIAVGDGTGSTIQTSTSVSFDSTVNYVAISAGVVKKGVSLTASSGTWTLMSGYCMSPTTCGFGTYSVTVTPPTNFPTTQSSSNNEWHVVGVVFGIVNANQYTVTATNTLTQTVTVPAPPSNTQAGTWGEYACGRTVSGAVLPYAINSFQCNIGTDFPQVNGMLLLLFIELDAPAGTTIPSITVTSNLNIVWSIFNINSIVDTSSPPVQDGLFLYGAYAYLSGGTLTQITVTANPNPSSSNVMVRPYIYYTTGATLLGVSAVKLGQAVCVNSGTACESLSSGNPAGVSVGSLNVPAYVWMSTLFICTQHANPCGADTSTNLPLIFNTVAYDNICTTQTCNYYPATQQPYYVPTPASVTSSSMGVANVMAYLEYALIANIQIQGGGGGGVTISTTTALTYVTSTLTQTSTYVINQLISYPSPYTFQYWFWPLFMWLVFAGIFVAMGRAVNVEGKGMIMLVLLGLLFGSIVGTLMGTTPVIFIPVFGVLFVVALWKLQ